LHIKALVFSCLVFCQSDMDRLGYRFMCEEAKYYEHGLAVEDRVSNL